MTETFSTAKVVKDCGPEILGTKDTGRSGIASQRPFVRNGYRKYREDDTVRVVVTEEAVKAAAGNKKNGREVMQLLLEQCGADVVVTEDVVRAVAGNKRRGEPSRLGAE